MRISRKLKLLRRENKIDLRVAFPRVLPDEDERGDDGDRTNGCEAVAVSFAWIIRVIDPEKENQTLQKESRNDSDS